MNCEYCGQSGEPLDNLKACGECYVVIVAKKLRRLKQRRKAVGEYLLAVYESILKTPDRSLEELARLAPEHAERIAERDAVRKRIEYANPQLLRKAIRLAEVKPGRAACKHCGSPRKSYARYCATCWGLRGLLHLT
jgi:hypothetical protein